MALDREDWITNRADNLADEQYHADFHTLPDSIQQEIFERAQMDWADEEAHRIEQWRESVREAVLRRDHPEIVD